MSEQIGAAMILAGLVLATVGGIWLAVRGLRLLFGRRVEHWRFVPLVLLGCGLLVGAAPFAIQRAYLAVVGLGERERVIDGDLALTLTGWDRSGYEILRTKSDVAILEMGNADVDDATLSLLLELPKLRELTLNDTAITDAGLSTLARLPSLESLRIARTHVTPEGVRRFLDAPPPRLRQIDVSGNDVPTSILRRWKNAADDSIGERRYVN